MAPRLGGDRAPRLALAFAFGTLNAFLFILALVRANLLEVLGSDAWPYVLLLWALAIGAAEWTLRTVDVSRPEPGDAARLLTRGTLAGVVLGGAMGAAFTLPRLEGLLFAMPVGVGVGLFAGAACSALDITILTLARAARRRTE